MQCYQCYPLSVAGQYLELERPDVRLLSYLLRRMASGPATARSVAGGIRGTQFMHTSSNVPARYILTRLAQARPAASDTLVPQHLATWLIAVAVVCLIIVGAAIAVLAGLRRLRYGKRRPRLS